MPDFQGKLAEIKSKLTPEAKLLIVSKTRPASDIKAYYDLGHRDFGENKVQELSEKALELLKDCPEIRWHMIGHLQSNKINALFKIPNLYAIHSVHDESLLEKLIKASPKLSQPVRIFLQVNTSHEEEKSGLENIDEVRRAMALLKDQHQLILQGLMTMGTLRTTEFEAEAQRCFRELHQMRVTLGGNLETSMGMSQDFEIALKEHSNWVRLGTMMFV